MDDQVSRPAPSDAARPVDDRGRAPSSVGWKVFAGVVALLVLSACACTSIAFVGAFDTDSVPRGSGDAVAVIYLDGVIMGTGSIYSGVVTPEYFVDQLEQAESDPRVRAIVMRVDSGGGTVAASQEIAMETARVTKPIVVSVGDVCASGSYMIASQCDEIIATPTSSIGSIGVIAQVPNLAGLLETLGIEFNVLTAGEYKDTGSLYRSMTATETALFQEYLDFSYEEFIAIVAEGRGLSEAEVREMATGWIWPGTVAEEMGLIDSTGTFNDAVDRAAELGGIEGEPRIVTYREPDYGWLMRALFGFSSGLEPLGQLAPGGDSIRHSLPR